MDEGLGIEGGREKGKGEREKINGGLYVLFFSLLPFQKRNILKTKKNISSGYELNRITLNEC